ncbi:MAG: hypothetical protein IPM75_08645 [Candidatus Competibacteraceae bacterium]|nr:hypothetical protein [Candidatus Competibacteraceae bacterium]
MSGLIEQRFGAGLCGLGVLSDAVLPLVLGLGVFDRLGQFSGYFRHRAALEQGFSLSALVFQCLGDFCKILGGAAELSSFLRDAAGAAGDFDIEAGELGGQLFDVFLLAVPLRGPLLLAAMVSQRIAAPALLPVLVATNRLQLLKGLVQAAGYFVLASRCGLEALEGAVEIRLRGGCRIPRRRLFSLGLVSRFLRRRSGFFRLPPSVFFRRERGEMFAHRLIAGDEPGRPFGGRNGVELFRQRMGVPSVGVLLDGGGQRLLFAGQCSQALVVVFLIRLRRRFLSVQNDDCVAAGLDLSVQPRQQDAEGASPRA